MRILAISSHSAPIRFSRIHYVIGIGSALLIGIILGNVVYFWRRAERIERELDELREQRIAHAREKNKENDNLFV